MMEIGLDFIYFIIFIYNFFYYIVDHYFYIHSNICKISDIIIVHFKFRNRSSCIICSILSLFFIRFS